jgi:hypothetical protein
MAAAEERQRLAAYGGDGRGGQLDEAAKYRLACERHEEALKVLRRERREAVARWSVLTFILPSTCNPSFILLNPNPHHSPHPYPLSRRRSCRTELERPEEDKAGSIRVDVFGHLRGACRKTDCAMWRRDVGKMQGWYVGRPRTSHVVPSTLSCEHDETDKEISAALCSYATLPE